MARGCGFRAPSQDMCVVASVKLIRGVIIPRISSRWRWCCGRRSRKSC